jgi:hypothetical protein
MHREIRKAYKILAEKPEGKRQLIKPKCRWQNIRIDLREIGFEGVDWI